MAAEVEYGAYIFQPLEVFSHNPLHDLESLWWVGVWLLVCHYHTRKLRDSDTTVHYHIEVVKRFGETLFSRFNVLISRRRALTSLALLANIEPRSFPFALQHLILLLDNFRDQLVTFYKLYKPMASQDQSFFNPDLFCKFSDIVEDAMKELRNDQTELWLIDHIKTNISYSNDKK